MKGTVQIARSIHQQQGFIHMESDRKNVPRLRQLANIERATSRKASESWQMFTIMAEFIDAAERLSELRPAVSMFGSSRIALCRAQ